MAHKEAMPDLAIPYLQAYSFTEAERERRLDLLSRFRPGQVSQQLAEAVFWIGEDSTEEEVEEMTVKRRKREWPWLRWMMKWGYPSGWIAGRGKLTHYLPSGIELNRKILLSRSEGD